MGFFGSLIGSVLGNNCISNAAYVSAAGAQGVAIAKQAAADIAIQVGVALWQRNASKSISNMQRQLAEQQMQLAEEVHAHAKLFWPEEAELVADVFGEARTNASYGGLPLVFGTIADAALDQARDAWVATARTLCLAPSRCEDARFQRLSVAGRADLISYGARQEEAREQISNDRRYARQLAVLGLSRGSLRSLISYQEVGQSSGLSASGILTDGINSALTLYGYESRRRGAPSGWGSGVRETWGERIASRMPGTVSRDSGWNGQPLPGMRTQPATALPMTKETEFDDVDWRGL